MACVYHQGPHCWFFEILNSNTINDNVIVTTKGRPSFTLSDAQHFYLIFLGR